MTTIAEKFTTLGTSIINLVGTRADKNLSNITSSGAGVIYEKSIIQPLTLVVNGAIQLQPNIQLYSLGTVSSNTTVSFTRTDIPTLENGTAYTFEVLLAFDSTIYTVSFPSTVRWQDGKTPNMTQSGLYIFSFRTMDNFTTVKGSLQGRWS